MSGSDFVLASDISHHDYEPQFVRKKSAASCMFTLNRKIELVRMCNRVRKVREREREKREKRNSG